MCKNCGTNNCNCNSSQSQDIAQLKNQLEALQNSIDSALERTKFLEGHPILGLSDATDIAMFDNATGIGSDKWEGWGIANGNTYKTSDNKNFTSANVIDRFQVGAGGAYSVGSTGGADSVALTTPQIPSHTHTVTDPGHNHEITDPGHDHDANSDPHTHTFTGSSHNHSIAGVGDHVHYKTFKVEVNANIDTTGGSQSYLVNDTGSADSSETMGVDPAGAHDHGGATGNAASGGSIGNATVSIAVDNSFTGITVNDNTTGITIGNTGDGQAHENRPPYIGILFVQRVG